MKVLIIQTAFLGDVILSLPLIQVLKNNLPDSCLDFLCIPKTKEILDNNPYINDVIIYDKHSAGNSIAAFNMVVSKIKSSNYDVVISIQRFLRSTLLAKRSGAPKTISYKNSVFSFLYTDTVEYSKKHEILRVLDLLQPLGFTDIPMVKPELFPSENDKNEVLKVFNGLGIKDRNQLISVAPGSVWFTKRFPKEKFVKVLDLMDKEKFKVALIGGSEDVKLCNYIISKTTNNEVYNLAGKLSILQSAQLIKNSSLLITNDSAPLHLANSVGTKVIALFGSTTKEFGFYPIGDNDKVFEISNLNCRPCSNHGKNICPIHTFECMNKIAENDIYDEVKKSLLHLS